MAHTRRLHDHAPPYARLFSKHVESLAHFAWSRSLGAQAVGSPAPLVPAHCWPDGDWKKILKYFTLLARMGQLLRPGLPRVCWKCPYAFAVKSHDLVSPGQNWAAKVKDAVFVRCDTEATRKTMCELLPETPGDKFVVLRDPFDAGARTFRRRWAGGFWRQGRERS